VNKEEIVSNLQALVNLLAKDTERPTVERTLARLQAGEISVEEASKTLDAATPKRQLYCKVSEKGGLSVYGLQRMPVTLYVEQWQRLLEFADEIKSFIVANDSKLKRKG
jgi:hypothetical protein